MFSKIRKWFGKSTGPGHCLYMDGDQFGAALVEQTVKHLSAYDSRAFVKIRAKGDSNFIKRIKGLIGCSCDIVLLDGYKSRKEVTDKYIMARIQRDLRDGAKSISVMSCDSDFIDIFRMLMMLIPSAKEVQFKLIVHESVIPPSTKSNHYNVPADLPNVSVKKVNNRASLL